MPSSSRTRTLVTIAFTLSATSCSPSPSATPQACQDASQCSATSRCVSSTCVANAPPTAAVTLPSGPLEAGLLLSFDGSASADPDAGDSISHAWVFRASAAPCAPPVVAGTGATAQVRFACPGTYAVDLTVTDQMNAHGAATKEFQVAQYSGPALLTLGPDVVVEHVCTDAPRRCTPASPVALSAVPTAAAPGDVTLSWTVEPPPGLPLGETRRVVLTPGADSPTPGVSISTDGQAISGDWIFHVEARDAAGLVASGSTRVSVKNRVPIVIATIPVPNHVFDGAQFSASGEIPFTISDPDGDDVLAPTAEWRHVGDGQGSFGGVLNGAQAKILFTVQVPYSTPFDAGQLIGGGGLERTILFTVRDANGGVTSHEWPILVGNRPPALALQPPPATVDHTYNPLAVAYEATPSLSTWTDPDGDPLEQVPGSSTGDPSCPSFQISAAGTAVAHCSQPFGGNPLTLGVFAVPHTVEQRVRDPWAEAGAASTVHFTIGNRAPLVTTTAPFTYGNACLGTGCCDFGPPGEGCLVFRGTSPSGSATVSSRFGDPDGDPMSVFVTSGPTVTPAQPLVCTPSTCALRLDFAEAPNVCGSTTETLSVTLSDGVVGASGALPVKRSCFF